MQAEQKKSGVSIGNWMGALFLLAIPVVNLIMLVVWAITSSNRTKRNYCIATLIWIAIIVVISVLGIVFFGPQIVEFLSGLNEQLSAM